MPRYFFHVRGPDQRLIDERGLDLPDAEAAWYQAVRSARELIRADLALGSSWEGQAVEIADERGAAVDRIALGEIVTYAF